MTLNEVDTAAVPKTLGQGPLGSPIEGFAEAIVGWQITHGRSSLPWQNTRDPYRVWLSEIMLQQTQVVTVMGYYARFLQAFPTVEELAGAPLDDVLALWSGLGYYSRARNLHRCAQDVVALHGGVFPNAAEQLQTLPGIGPSTAAAIASFCFAERVAILDANVKRVLARVLAYSGDLARSAEERQLWQLATRLLPTHDLSHAMPRYTQGVMDLGASLCSVRQPQCLLCPVRGMCQSHRAGEMEKYPVKTRKLKRSAMALYLLWLQRSDGAVWLEKRPVPGVWGGLYCLPVFLDEPALQERVPASLAAGLHALPSVTHVLTHKDLYLQPHWREIDAAQAAFWDEQSNSAGAWFAPVDWPSVGLPAPIRKMLLQGPLSAAG